MMVTREMLAEQLALYLNRQLTRERLIGWCEEQMQEATFENSSVKEIIARIGLMDAKNFEVTYEDLSSMLSQLGYKVKVEVV